MAPPAAAARKNIRKKNRHPEIGRSAAKVLSQILPLSSQRFSRSYNIMKGGMSSSIGNMRSISTPENQDQFRQTVAFHVGRSARQGLDELLLGNVEVIKPEAETILAPPPVASYHHIPEPIVTRPSYVSADSIPVWNIAQNGAVTSGKRVLPPMIHDISFIDRSLFTPGCMVAQVWLLFNIFPNFILFSIVTI